MGVVRYEREIRRRIVELSDIQALSEKLAQFADQDLNEQTTKYALIVPLVKMLGYDPGNPLEVVFEYDAAFGVKKDAKVDIAILREGKPIMLIECKPLQAKLGIDKISQLYTYFAACPETRIGILTNGRQYMLFSDLETQGTMDSVPFLAFDLLKDGGRVFSALQKLSKGTWDLDSVIASAVRLKRLAAIKTQISQDATEPDDDVVKHYANSCYKGMKVQAVIEEFRPLVVQAFKDYVSDRIKEFLNPTDPKPEPDPVPAPAPEPEPEPVPVIVTHDSEKFAYVAVKTLLSGTIEPSRVQMHDYKGFCSVQLDGKPSKTICRFRWFEPVAEDGTIGKSACIDITGSDGGSIRHPLGTIEDILPLADELAQAARLCLEAES